MNDKDFDFFLDEKPFVCKAFSVFPLDDGIYEVLVVDAVDEPDGNGVQLELVLTAGSVKGDVVRLRATHLGRVAISVLGLPGTLTVTDGAPHLSLE